MRPKERQPQWVFLGGWVRLAEGLACILSLGFWYPMWVVPFQIWKLKRLYPVTDEE